MRVFRINQRRRPSMLDEVHGLAEQTIRTSDTEGATRETASERHIFRLLIAVDKWITGIVFSWRSSSAWRVGGARFTWVSARGGANLKGRGAGSRSLGRLLPGG
jgi:hypothetical protein